MAGFNNGIALLILAATAGIGIGMLLGLVLRGRSVTVPAIGIGALLLAGCFGYFALDYRMSARNATERRGLEERRAELSRQAMQADSKLACIDGLAGDAVESACRAALFETPQITASAVARASERLRLLADSVAFARHVDPAYAATVADLRRAAERDPYGLYAHVLAIRDGCTPERCWIFELLADAQVLKTNLREQTYEHRVAEYALRWRRATEAPASPSVSPQTAPTEAPAAANTTAAAPPPEPPPLPAASGPITGPLSWPPTAAGEVVAPRVVVPPVASVLPNLDFPSAQSIPAVSIMAPEPPAATVAEPAKPATPLPRSAPRQHAAEPE
jgi:hypothetical protein